MLKPAFSDGHFYSPIIDPDEVGSARSRIWREHPRDPPGVDFRAAEQRSLLRSLAAPAQDFDYPESAPSGPPGDHQGNGMFESLDARMLFCMLRHLRPRRLIEVGGGFSSLLAADVNTRFLRSATEITCIEPFPPDWLRAPVPGIHRVMEERVHNETSSFRKTTRSSGWSASSEAGASRGACPCVLRARTGRADDGDAVGASSRRPNPVVARNARCAAPGRVNVDWPTSVARGERGARHDLCHNG